MITSHLSGVIEEIPISRIRPAKYILRTEANQIEYLRQSISEKGLLQPIIVRPVNHQFEVVAGNRRLEALRLLDYRVVPAHVVELDDREAYEVALIENVQRKTLNPVEEAEAYLKYVETFGWGGISDLAKRIGKSQECISRKLKLLSLPEDVKSEIAKGVIKPSVATELAKLMIDDGEALVHALTHGMGNGGKITRSQIRQLRSQGNATCEAEFHRYDPRDDTRRVRTLNKAVSTLRIAMSRLDILLDNAKSGDLEGQILFEYRQSLHTMIDSLIKMKKKIEIEGR